MSDAEARRLSAARALTFRVSESLMNVRWDKGEYEAQDGYVKQLTRDAINLEEWARREIDRQAEALGLTFDCDAERFKGEAMSELPKRAGTWFHFALLTELYVDRGRKLGVYVRVVRWSRVFKFRAPRCVWRLLAPESSYFNNKELFRNG